MPDSVRITMVEQDVSVQLQPTQVTIASPGPQGAVGPQGDPGAPGGTYYLHTQSTPAATWTVAHGLGRLVHVTLFDATGLLTITDVDQGDTDTATITWAVPTAGSAVFS